MRFQTGFHVGSTRGYRGNGKLIIEMKPTSFSYHAGQLCGSCVFPVAGFPPLSPPVGMCPVIRLFSASLYQSIQTYSGERSAGWVGVKRGAVIE